MTSASKHKLLDQFREQHNGIPIIAIFYFGNSHFLPRKNQYEHKNNHVDSIFAAQGSPTKD